MGYGGRQSIRSGDIRRFNFTGNGSNTAFDLGFTPATQNQLIVTVNGLVQHYDAFSISGSTLTFDGTPASGDAIQVTAVVDAVGVAAIPDGAVANVSTLTVSGNTTLSGVLTATANVNLDSGTLFVDGTNNRVGINNTAPTSALTVTGNTTISGALTVSSASGIAFSDASTQTTAATGFGFKNRIINGDMRIDQRNAGASVTPTNGQYSVDRWLAYLTQASKFTVQQSSTAPPGFAKSLLVTSSSAYSGVSGDLFNIGQFIEGYNTADLGWGTAAALPVTLSFWVRSSLTGTFGGVIRNTGGGTRSYPFSYTINSANTWEYETITIAGDTTGTWDTTNGQGIGVLFDIGTGSTYEGTAGAWANSNLYGTTGATSIIGTSGATWYIAGVQLERGSTATAFDYRDYGRELALCQRYFEKTYNIETAVGSNGDGGRINHSATSDGNGNFITDINFKVTKRANPTMTAYVGGGTSGLWTYERSGASGTNAVTFDVSGTSHLRAYVGVGVNWTACYVYGHWTASAEL